VRPVQVAYKPSDFGLPGYLDEKAGNAHQVPRVDFSSMTSMSDTYPTLGSRSNTGQLKAAATVFRGKHSLKIGWEERRYWFASSSPGYSSGRLAFNSQFVKAADNTTTASNQGLEFAAFLMGMPSSISIDTNDSGMFSTRYRSFYFQVDWRASRRLHLTLGLRYERETGATERFDRGVAGGFLFDATLPFTDAVLAAYAANPLPELPAPQFKVTGGHAAFDLRRLPSRQVIEIDTPRAAFTVDRPGYYRVDVEETRTTFSARRGGSASLVAENGEQLEVGADQQLVLADDNPTFAVTPAAASDDWDRWNDERSASFAETPRSAQYVSQEVAGVDDLDQYGEWHDEPRYGRV
jgi:hypothetical protein